MIVFLLVLILLAVLRLFWLAAGLAAVVAIGGLYVYGGFLAMAVLHDVPLIRVLFWTIFSVLWAVMLTVGVRHYYRTLHTMRANTTPEQRGWH